MKKTVVLILSILFFTTTHLFAQNMKHSDCYDSCITVLDQDAFVLKRIVQVKYKMNNILGVIGSKSFGFGTSENNILIPIQFDAAKPFYKGYAVVGLNGKYGVIDSVGKLVIAFKYKALSNVNEGFAFYSINGNQVDGVVDVTGKEYRIDVLMGAMPLEISPNMITIQSSSLGSLAYDDIYLIDYRFSEGFAIINNKVMNKEMKFLFTSNYKLDKTFKEGVVKMSWKSSSGNTLYGFLDTQGKVTVRPIYLSAEDFVNDRSLVTSGNPLKPLRQIIDKKGVVLETIEYKY